MYAGRVNVAQMYHMQKATVSRLNQRGCLNSCAALVNCFVGEIFVSEQQWDLSLVSEQLNQSARI